MSVIVIMDNGGINENGSFHCECDIGYTLDDDGL